MVTKDVSQTNGCLFLPPERPTWFLPAWLFDGAELAAHRAILIDEGGVIQQISDANAVLSAPDSPPIIKYKGIAAPGLLDVQVNGGGGVMFNTSPTVAGIAQIIAAHRARGTAWIMPTFITDQADQMQRAADAMSDAWHQGLDGLAGVHFEGPHINPARKGAHLEKFIRPFDEVTRNILRQMRSQGIPTMVTLAPECVAPGVVAELAAMGVVVALGHSDASEADLRRAEAEGARAVTHLFNGMSGWHSRAPGLVGAALDSHLVCGVIADLHHVAATSLRLAIRARPAADLMMVVSDAMATIGGPDHYEIYGEVIRVEDGRLVNQAGSLAGAHIDLAGSVVNLVQAGICDTATALAMATRVPAQLMGVWPRIGRLNLGARGVTLLRGFQ
ncbi:MAG: N-acetylglucosamine-6-phosphate deacetylase [Candidatus Symbiobacter sp.]|nr:N-acetylglucosamine-6-phosphate deacetylase [Candidatus Symbiobacter sp.]